MGQKLSKQQLTLSFGDSGEEKDSACVLVLSQSTMSIQLNDALNEAFRGVKVHKNKLKPILLSEVGSLVRISSCAINLCSVSPNIALLVNTTKLQLCCNNLKEIPAEIGYMKNLTSLSLAKNKITFLPESIGLLAKLTDLKLSRNLLSTLPASIKNLTNLVSLKMARNNFTSLPSELGLLSALICLDLSHNKLTSIPVEVGRLKYLKSLKVDDVSFSHPGFINPVPEMATLSSFPTLKELAARLVVLHQIPIWQHTDQCLKEYLLSSHSCSFCQGPYFDSHVKRIRVVSRNEFGIPMEDRLCIDHWKTDLERLKLMFCAKPKNVFTAVPQPESNSKKIRRFSKLASTNSFDSITTIPLSSIDSSPTLPKLPESIITHKGLFGFYKKKKTDNCADVPMNAVRSEQM